MAMKTRAWHLYRSPSEKDMPWIFERMFDLDNDTALDWAKANCVGQVVVTREIVEGRFEVTWVRIFDPEDAMLFGLTHT
jgi:hypothetical protein